MSNFSFEVESGKTVKLATAGKYCDRDIVVTATGGGNTDAAYQQGVADGKQAEYDAFWDGYQQMGSRNNYSNAFRVGWSNAVFKPKYDIKGSGSYASAFAATDISGDLASLLDGMGRKLDTSKATSLNSLFYNAVKITRIPIIDTSGTSDITYMFESASALKTIDKVILKNDGSQSMNAFRGLTALENLVIEGTIGQNGLNIQASTKLSHDSIMSIIGALKNYSGTGTTMTVTLGATNLAKLTDAEKAIATEKGWTLA